jgi:hypothetical protein
MADVLSKGSRDFFERTKVKLAVSIVVASGGVMLLGFCAYSAGQAASYNTMVSESWCFDCEAASPMPLTYFVTR